MRRFRRAARRAATTSPSQLTENSKFEVSNPKLQFSTRNVSDAFLHSERQREVSLRAKRASPGS